MTQDEIIEMVNQIGCKSYSPPPTRSVAGVSMTFAQVKELIKLVAAKERSDCVFTASVALLGSEKQLADRVINALLTRG